MSTPSLPIRVALHVDRTGRRPVDPAAVALLEVEAAERAVRLPLRDSRSTGELVAVLEPSGSCAAPIC